MLGGLVDAIRVEFVRTRQERPRFTFIAFLLADGAEVADVGESAGHRNVRACASEHKPIWQSCDGLTPHRRG